MLKLKEDDILIRVNQGDIKSFERLYSTFYVYLCAVATKYIYDAETAKEIVNDVFVSIWNNHTLLTAPVNAYLVRAVKNRCLNHLRQKRLEEVPLTDIQENLLHFREGLVGQPEEPLQHLEQEESQEKVLKAINLLPKKCRDIFIQYLYHNKSSEEIAAEQYISSSTVRVQIKIALTKLKPLLKDITITSLAFFIFFKNNPVSFKRFFSFGCI